MTPRSDSRAQLRPLRAETPMAFVRAIVLGYEKYGQNPANALHQARILPSQLDKPRARIDADQMETLSATAMQELDDEALGWFSRRLPWGTYGMLCRASLTAPTLGVALKLWCRHHRLLTEDITLSIEGDRTLVHLTIQEHRALGEMREFCLLTSLRYVHGYACWLVNSQLPLREVSFPFATPPHPTVYPLLFPGPVRFDADRTRLTLEARYLDLSPKRDARALRTMLKRALPLTVRQYRRDRLLVERVRERLNDANGPLPTADALATALHVSVRSLHRQLANEGASLQTLKDDVHRQRSIDLLLRTALPIKQIALAVGFTNEKSFSRAFKRWTGDSPTEHRRGAVRL